MWGRDLGDSGLAVMSCVAKARRMGAEGQELTSEEPTVVRRR